MQKQSKIVQMFDEIAGSYDLANRVLSFGSDIAWRRRACREAMDLVQSQTIERITDVACGTGDMLLFWQKEAERRGRAVGEYLGVDPSAGMLEIARKKVPSARFIQAYAQDLPLEDNSSEILSITYGIRNVVERQKAIGEFYRVLKKGGVLVILEFTRREQRSLADGVVDFYMKKVLPFIGGLVSGNREAYEYLPNSIDAFLSTEQLVGELEAAGFEVKRVKSFSFGISTMFIAQK
jgi:demethylmenaquinone methyltransferase/2-methoxy-6-polyprenyl-1,4-benzoquinol methylase